MSFPGSREPGPFIRTFDESLREYVQAVGIRMKQLVVDMIAKGERPEQTIKMSVSWFCPEEPACGTLWRTQSLTPTPQ